MHKFMFLVLLLVPLIGMSACASAHSSAIAPVSSGLPSSSVTSTNTTPTQKEPVTPVSKDELSTLISGNNAFTFDLYKKLSSESGNIFYSPYSISNALALTYAGARGNTAQQMASALHFGLSNTVLPAAINALRLDLEKRNNSDLSQLSMANALWGQKGRNFLPAYIQQVNDSYGGTFKTLDFVKATEPARLEINQWASQKTAGRISEMLKPGDINQGTVLAITNTIYFKAPWSFVFKKDGTVDDVFHTLGGATTIVPMMQHDVMQFRYLKGDNFQAIDLPYRYTDLSMLILVPDENQFTGFENSLDNQKLASVLSGMQLSIVTLSMPKFKFASNYRLNDYLKALGMVDAFVNADFSGMTGDPGLFLTEVLHSTLISVDENGTEAAAGTAAFVAGMKQVNLLINRPFIFLIMDKDTGSILFLGRVLNPNN